MTTPSQSGGSKPPTKPGTPITKPKPQRPGMPRPTRYVDSKDLGLRGPQGEPPAASPSVVADSEGRAGFPPVPGAVPSLPRCGDGPPTPGSPPPAPPPPFPPNPFPRPFAG